MTEVEALRLELETTRSTNLACVKRMQREIDSLTKRLEWSEKELKHWLQVIHDRDDQDQYHEDRLIAATGGL